MGREQSSPTPPNDILPFDPSRVHIVVDSGVEQPPLQVGTNPDPENPHEFWVARGIVPPTPPQDDHHTRWRTSGLLSDLAQQTQEE